MKPLPSRVWCVVIGSLAWGILACGASAQTEERREELVLVLGDHLEWLDVAALTARLGVLADVVVRDAATERTSELSIHMRGARRARVELTRVDGRRIGRTVSLPSEARERVETLAILAANLLRDESAELLAMLRPRPDAPTDSVPETPDGTASTEASEPSAVEPSANEAAAGVSTAGVSTADVRTPETDTADADTAESGTAENVSDTAEPSTTEPDAADVGTAEPSTTDPDAAPLDAPIERAEGTMRPPFLRLGLSGELGSVPRGAGYEVDLLYGLELSWTAPELVAIGLRDVGVRGLPEGREGITVDFAPFVELSGSFEFLTLYGQIGAHTQVVVDFGINEHFGVAPLAAVGVRFRLIPEMSIGLETVVRVVASERFTTALHSLPQLSVPWMAGLALLFHIS